MTTAPACLRPHKATVTNSTYGVDLCAIYQQLNVLGSSLPIISVGSGQGQVERELCDVWYDSENRTLICVDPSPDSFPGPIFNQGMKPHYKTIDEAILAHPEYIQNCVLLMIWPNPTETSDPEDKLVYDVEAISRLKPAAIVMLVEVFGGAGSQQLHAWRSLQLNRGFADDIHMELLDSQSKLLTLKKNCAKLYRRVSSTSYVQRFIVCGHVIRVTSCELYLRTTWKGKGKQPQLTIPSHVVIFDDGTTLEDVKGRNAQMYRGLLMGLFA